MTDTWHDSTRVTLDVFQGEPLARLAAQRLEEEGIPCVVRPLGVGPGGWGMAANLPHAIHVRPSDADRARDVLGMPPIGEDGENEVAQAQGRRWPTGVLVVLVLIAAAVLISAADRLFAALLR